MLELNSKELSKYLSETDSLIPLLTKLRDGEHLTERERQLIWVGVYNLAYSLARKHYGEPQNKQSNPRWAEFHEARIEVIFDFILESTMPMRGVIFAVYRRFAWIELIVEMKVLGISYLEHMTTTKKINSIITKEIILGNRIKRGIYEDKGYCGYREIIIGYIQYLSGRCETISLNRIERFISRYRGYAELKDALRDSFSFDEAYFRPSDGIVS